MKSRLKHPIRSIREPFGKAGLTVAILALVLAMVGGAYAAGGLTKSQEKQVTKIAKKYAGKPGAAGANGTNGTPGANGTNGAPGAKGENGVSVTTSAATVAECASGGIKVTSASPAAKVCNGTTGFTETLPKGKTETGVWATGVDPSAELLEASISFTIPLATVIAGSEVHVVEPGPLPAGCTGSLAEPGAEEGNLCVFVAELSAGALGATVHPNSFAGSGTGKTGAVVTVTSLGGEMYGSGTWAVTAE